MSATKNVLMITYSWPPDNAAGVHRPLRFARWLSKIGWQPTILASDSIAGMRFDTNLAERVPAGINVFRVGERDPWRRARQVLTRRQAKIAELPSDRVAIAHASRKSDQHGFSLYQFIAGTIKRLEAGFYHPDHRAGWIVPAVRQGKKILAEQQFDAIWVTGNPWSALKVGQQLAVASGVPLTLDLRDPWTLDPDSSYLGSQRPGWAHALDRRSLAQCFRTARTLVLLNERYAEAYLAAYPDDLNESKIHIIPNGFDPVDLQVNDATDTQPSDRLRIVHTGVMGLRDYGRLFDAVSLLPADDQKCLDIVFLGECPPSFRQAVQAAGLTEIVQLLPVVPFDEASAYQRSAHVLLVLGKTPSPGYELHIASKVFQYMTAHRPILGILADNESRAVLEHINAKLIADVNDEEAIVARLKQILAAWRENNLSTLQPEWERCVGYSAPRQAAALSAALANISPVHGYYRGKTPLPSSLHFLLNRP